MFINIILITLEEELSLLGNGYIQLSVSNPVERRLELGFYFKTVSQNAVVMHGQGIYDFHAIMVININSNIYFF